MLYIHKKKNQKMNQLKWIFIFLISCCIIILTLLVLLKMTSKDHYKLVDRTEKIEELKKKDTDGYSTIGWIKIQGTNIDTPVLGFNSSSRDEIKVELENYVWNLDENGEYYNKIDIIGHNILNLSSQPEVNLEYFSRFDDLMAFIYYDFAKENKYIQYTVNGKNYLYKIFSVYFEDSYIVQSYEIGNKNQKYMKELIGRYKSKSFYDYSLDVNEKDDIISVITCTRFYGTEKSVNFIVNGRRVRDNEKINDYKVKENKNYKKIKEVLEGENDEDNEV